jgi:xylulokinase
MSEKTKVIAGGGTRRSALSEPARSQRRLSISLGTSGVVFASNATYCRIESGAMHSFRHADGRFHMMGVMLSAAGSNDWWVKSILRDSNNKEVDQGAAAAKAEGLYFLPYLTANAARSTIRWPAAPFLA